MLDKGRSVHGIQASQQSAGYRVGEIESNFALGDRYLYYAGNPFKGSDVRQLQEVLASLRLYGGVIDGVFGEPTYHAIITFQRLRDLPDDGIVGAKTMAALLGVVQAEEATA